MDDAPISDDPGNETGREEMLLALREHDLRERVFEGYPDAIVLVDANGTITDMNRRAAQLLGRTVDERIDYEQVVVGEDGHGNPRTQDGPVTVRRADGSTASAEARTQTLEGTDGPITAVVLVERAAGNTEASPSERDR